MLIYVLFLHCYISPILGSFLARICIVFDTAVMLFRDARAYDHVYICNLGLFATMPGPVAFSQVLKEEGSKLFCSSTETFIAEMLRIVL